jgi:hypothetical protein
VNRRNASRTFYWLVAALQLRGIDFVVSGGLAARSYGATRPLNDIDIDIANADVERLRPVVGEYVSFGPDRYRDGKRDLLLMTLKHEGQMVDISGGDDARIYDEKHKAWILERTDFSDIEWRKVFGLVVPVMAPRPLMTYKALLNGAHQQSDVLAVRRFVASRDAAETERQRTTISDGGTNEISPGDGFGAFATGRGS